MQDPPHVRFLFAWCAKILPMEKRLHVFVCQTFAHHSCPEFDQKLPEQRAIPLMHSIWAARTALTAAAGVAVELTGLEVEAVGCEPSNNVMVAAGAGVAGAFGAESVLVAGLSVAFLPRSAAFLRASSWAALAAASISALAWATVLPSCVWHRCSWPDVCPAERRAPPACPNKSAVW